MVNEALKVIARAYSVILFLDSPVLGVFIAAVTLIYPNIGLSGLLAAVVAALVTRIFQLPYFKSGLHVYNSLLVGLSLGAFYSLNYYIIALIIIAAIFTVFLTAALADSFWRANRLPIFSLPFVLVASVSAVVAQQYTALNNFADYQEYYIGWLGPLANDFFNSLGATFFTTHPIAGVILFLSIIIRSRYLAALAISGYIIGQLLLILLTNSPNTLLFTWTGFNFVLVAMAIGGIYTIPGWASWSTAMLGVALAALLIIAVQKLFFVYGLPFLVLPFVITTLIMLTALKARLSISPPWLSPQPGLPEKNYETARLAKVRNGELNSVPLLVPFNGQWRIYQGFNGDYTHKPPWQYALDFFITQDDKSFKRDGSRQQDYYCFGMPVLSPSHGQVARIYAKLNDNLPGEVDTRNNWGNFILIRLDSGLHVLIAHLQQDSIKVKEGDRVTPGMVIAACGNSGRSPQPHIHLQVQRSAELGSPTHPFHLSSVMHYSDNNKSEYLLVARPTKGDLIEATAVDEILATQLHLPVGRQFAYALAGFKVKANTLRRLQVELTLLGQFRLVSDTGASAAFEEVNGVLAFYDRQGPKDILVDMWLLCNGLTPLTESAYQWRDSPSAHFMPLTLRQKSLLHLLRPLGCGLDSQYRRQWHPDQDVWLQHADHELSLGSSTWRAQTQSTIDPILGCREMSLTCNAHTWHAVLKETGLAKDEGIPGWKELETATKIA